MSFIARQPNGLLCRYSSVADTITDWNMTDEQYVFMCAEKAADEARNTIKYYCKTFEYLSCEFFRFDSGVSEKEIEQIFRMMGETPEHAEHRRKYWEGIGVYDTEDEE